MTEASNSLVAMRVVAAVATVASTLSIWIGPHVENNPSYDTFNADLQRCIVLQMTLCACTAATIPMVLDMILDWYKSSVDEHLFERMLLVVSFLVVSLPPLIIRGSFRLAQVFVATNAVQNILLLLACVAVLHKLQGSIWTGFRSLTIIVIWCVACVVAAFYVNTSGEMADFGQLIVRPLMYSADVLFMLLTAQTTRAIYFRHAAASKNSPTSPPVSLSSNDLVSIIFMYSPLCFGMCVYWYAVVDRGVTVVTQRNGRDLAVIALFQLVLTLSMVVFPSRLARYEVIHVRQALEAKQQLARHVYHEMRTPLNIVVMGLELLSDVTMRRKKLLAARRASLQSENDSSQMEPDFSDTEELLDNITLACSTTIEILNDMLVYDKLDSGVYALDLAYFSVVPFVQQTVQPFELQARNKGVRIKVIDRMHGNNGAVANNSFNSSTGGQHDNEPSSQNNASSIVSAANLLGRLGDGARRMSSRESGAGDSVNSNGRTTDDGQPTSQHALSLVRNIPKYHIKVDPVKMGQVLHSFLSNAIKYTPAGGSISVVIRVMPGSKGDVSSRTRRNTLTGRLRRALRRYVESWRRRRQDGSTVLPMARSSYNSNGDSPMSSTTVTPRKVVDSQNSDSAGSGTDSGSNNNNRSIPYKQRLLHKKQTPSLNLFQQDPQHPTVRISVTDTGAGMSAQDLSQLFHDTDLDTHFQANELQGGGGSGFGLKIAKGIVDLHHGSVGASSNGVGKGSTFFVELPLYMFVPPTNIAELGGFQTSGGEGGPALTGPRSDGAEEIPSTGDGNSARRVVTSLNYNEGSERQAMIMYPLGLQSGNGLQVTATAKSDYGVKRVLLVDDSDVCRRMVRRLLMALDSSMEIDDVDSGQACIDILRRRREEQMSQLLEHDVSPSAVGVPDLPDYYDLIIMDNQMPGISGPQTATELRSATGAAGFVHNGLIIGLSGLADEQDMKEFSDAGADVVLVKPIDSGVLLRTLKQYKSRAQVEGI